MARAPKATTGEPDRQDRRKQLMKTMDTINARFGRGAVVVGSAGVNTDSAWHTKQTRLSPNYTTVWQDIPFSVAKSSSESAILFCLHTSARVPWRIV